MENIKHIMKNCISSTTRNATYLGAPVPVTGVQAGGRAALLTGIISHGHGWLPDILGKTDRHTHSIPNITFVFFNCINIIEKSNIRLKCILY